VRAVYKLQTVNIVFLQSYSVVVRYTTAIRQLSADFDCYLCNSSTSIFVSDLDFSLYLSTAILTGKKQKS